MGQSEREGHRERGDRERERGCREREKERAGHRDGLKEREGLGLSLKDVLVV